MRLAGDRLGSLADLMCSLRNTSPDSSFSLRCILFKSAAPLRSSSSLNSDIIHHNTLCNCKSSFFP